MVWKRYTAEEIIGHLRTIEIEIGKGVAGVEAWRKLGITERTYRYEYLDGKLFDTLLDIYLSFSVLRMEG